MFANDTYDRDVGAVEDVPRETIGLEEALLGGRASVGLRLPFFQVRGHDAGNGVDVGDLRFRLSASGSRLTDSL